MDHQDMNRAVKEVARQKGLEITHHPDEAVLADYLDDLLEQTQDDEVKEHLVWCQDCGLKLDLIASDFPMEKPVPAPIRKLWPVHLGWAALLLLGLGLSMWPKGSGVSEYRLHLARQGPVRGDESIRVGPEHARISFELDADVRSDQGPFFVSIQGPNGQTATSERVYPGFGQRFHVSFPRAALPKRVTGVRLLGGPKKTELISYPLDLRLD